MGSKSNRTNSNRHVSKQIISARAVRNGAGKRSDSRAVQQYRSSALAKKLPAQIATAKQKAKKEKDRG